MEEPDALASSDAIRGLLSSNALDLGPAGADSSFGFGKLRLPTIAVKIALRAERRRRQPRRDVAPQQVGRATLRAAIQ